MHDSGHKAKPRNMRAVARNINGVAMTAAGFSTPATAHTMMAEDKMITLITGGRLAFYARPVNSYEARID